MYADMELSQYCFLGDIHRNAFAGYCYIHVECLKQFSLV